jgi:hypothetical protein
MSTSVAAWASGSNRQQLQSCGGTESNSGRSGESAGLGQRNRLPYSEAGPAGSCLKRREKIAILAYFIRRRGGHCVVIALLPDNREEVVQDGLTLIEAEIPVSCEDRRPPDLPRLAAQQAVDDDPGRPPCDVRLAAQVPSNACSEPRLASA